jgi:predicted metal-dependent hydrolase
MTHTPGPWTVYSQPNQSSGDEGDTAWWYSLEAPADGSTFAEHEANARLIAAAPEMNDALKYAENVLAKDPASDRGHKMKALRLIRAAIAKAEGNT